MIANSSAKGMPAGISICYRSIIAIRKHVVAYKPLPCCRKCIPVDKPAHFRVVESALEVVEACLGIVDIAPVADGVQRAQGGCHRAAGFEKFAPGVIGVGDHCGTGGVQDGGDIALKVCCIVIGGAVMDQGEGRSGCVIEEGQGIAAYGHAAQEAAVIDIAVGFACALPFCPEAVHIVGVGPGGAVIGYLPQLPPVLPDIASAVQRSGISDFVAVYRDAVIGDQQIAPGRIVEVSCRIGCRTKGFGGVGIFALVQNVARSIVGPGPAFPFLLVVLPDQLVLAVADMGCGNVVARGPLCHLDVLRSGRGCPRATHRFVP